MLLCPWVPGPWQVARVTLAATDYRGESLRKELGGAHALQSFILEQCEVVVTSVSSLRL